LKLRVAAVKQTPPVRHFAFLEPELVLDLPQFCAQTAAAFEVAFRFQSCGGRCEEVRAKNLIFTTPLPGGDSTLNCFDSIL